MSASTAELRSLLARAFERDPMFEWMFPDAANRLNAVAGFLGLLVEFYSEHGHVEWISDDDGVAVGVVLWRTTEHSEPRPATRTLPTVGGYLAAIGGVDHAKRVGAGLAVIVEFLPQQRYAYLNVLGVDPAHQRTGVGTRAIRQVIDFAAEAGVPVHLETTNQGNVAWYERHGFAVVGSATLGDDGPQLWAMTRPVDVEV